KRSIAVGADLPFVGHSEPLATWMTSTAAASRRGAGSERFGGCVVRTRFQVRIKGESTRRFVAVTYGRNAMRGLGRFGKVAAAGVVIAALAGAGVAVAGVNDPASN